MNSRIDEYINDLKIRDLSQNTIDSYVAGVNALFKEVDTRMLKSLEKLREHTFIGHGCSELAEEIQAEIDKFYLPRPLFEDGEPADFGMEFVSNKGIVERIEHIDLFPEWAEINSYGSTTDWTYREDKPIKRPQEPDTQEKIDADTILTPLEYCLKHNIECGMEMREFEARQHLLERQRKLDGVE